MYLRIDSIAENGECRITKVNGDLVICAKPQDIPTKTKGHTVLGYNAVTKQCKPCTYMDALNCISARYKLTNTNIFVSKGIEDSNGNPQIAIVPTYSKRINENVIDVTLNKSLADMVENLYLDFLDIGAWCLNNSISGDVEICVKVDTSMFKRVLCNHLNRSFVFNSYLTEYPFRITRIYFEGDCTFSTIEDICHVFNSGMVFNECVLDLSNLTFKDAKYMKNAFSTGYLIDCIEMSDLGFYDVIPPKSMPTNCESTDTFEVSALCPNLFNMYIDGIQYNDWGLANSYVTITKDNALTKVIKLGNNGCANARKYLYGLHIAIKELDSGYFNERLLNYFETVVKRIPNGMITVVIDFDLGLPPVTTKGLYHSISGTSMKQKTYNGRTMHKHLISVVAQNQSKDRINAFNSMYGNRIANIECVKNIVELLKILAKNTISLRYRVSVTEEKYIYTAMAIVNYALMELNPTDTIEVEVDKVLNADIKDIFDF